MTKKWKTDDRGCATWREIGKGFAVQGEVKSEFGPARVVLMDAAIDAEYCVKSIPGNPTLEELRPRAMEMARKWFTEMAKRCVS